jgi:hypothetical protein
MIKDIQVFQYSISEVNDFLGRASLRATESVFLRHLDLYEHAKKKILQRNSTQPAVSQRFYFHWNTDYLAFWGRGARDSGAVSPLQKCRHHVSLCSLPASLRSSESMAQRYPKMSPLNPMSTGKLYTIDHIGFVRNLVPTALLEDSHPFCVLWQSCQWLWNLLGCNDENIHRSGWESVSDTTI